MKAATIERWVWVLIYGGSLLLCLAVFVGRGDAALAWTLGVAGGAAAAVGAALIVVRARMKDGGP